MIKQEIQTSSLLIDFLNVHDDELMDFQLLTQIYLLLFQTNYQYLVMIVFLFQIKILLSDMFSNPMYHFHNHKNEHHLNQNHSFLILFLLIINYHREDLVDLMQYNSLLSILNHLMVMM